LARAEEIAEINLFRSIQAAAKKKRHWRAAAWLLERRNPEDFAARPPELLTAQQVVNIIAQVAELLHGDLPEENCRRALEKLNELIFELKQDAYLAYATEHPEVVFDMNAQGQAATIDSAATSDATQQPEAPTVSGDCCTVAD